MNPTPANKNNSNEDKEECKKIAISKTILTMLPQTKSYCNDFRKAINIRASYSFQSRYDLETIWNKLIDKKAEIDFLENLERRSQTILTKTPQKHIRIINLYYFDKMPTKKISEHLGVNQRTVFRQINSATARFAQSLDYIGINSYTWSELLKSHRWIREIYNSQLAKSPKKPTTSPVLNVLSS